MTLVGKILTVVITALSLVFMSLAIVVYSAQTNWREKAQQQSQQIAKLQREINDLKKQRDELTLQYDEARKKLADQLARAQEELRNQQQTMRQLLSAYQQERKRAETANAENVMLVQEIQARRREVETLRQNLRVVLDDKDRAVREAFEAQQKLIELQGELEVAQERNKNLQKRIAELTAILVQHGLPTEARHVALLQQPPHVEGVVLEVDKQNRYLKISIGTDDQIVPGHRLHVYRERTGKYLGMIEIVEASEDHAVARVLPEMKQGRIEVGDHVATYLTGTGE